jgi:ketosteroid isomerase-like protein
MPAISPSQLSKQFAAAINTGDLDAAASLVDTDAVMRTPYGEILTGGDAIRENLANQIAGNAQLDNDEPLILAAGEDLALMIGDWRFEITAPTGDRVSATGTTANVAGHDGDGNWRWLVLNPTGTVR